MKKKINCDKAGSSTAVEGFDMSQCKFGDELITRAGEKAVYVKVELIEGDEYPYGVIISERIYFDWVTSKGEFFIGEHSDDIVGYWKDRK